MRVHCCQMESALRLILASVSRFLVVFRHPLMEFRVPDVRFSDHRPLVCDYRVRADAGVHASAA